MSPASVECPLASASGAATIATMIASAMNETKIQTPTANDVSDVWIVFEGLAALIRLDGGWAWKGPGHPVDNGDQARGQRDGLRSEGAARVLFFRGSRRVRHESEDSFVVFTGGRALREAGSAEGGGAGGGQTVAADVRRL